MFLLFLFLVANASEQKSEIPPLLLLLSDSLRNGSTTRSTARNCREWAMVRVHGHATLIPRFLGSRDRLAIQDSPALPAPATNCTENLVRRCRRDALDPRGRRRNCRGSGSSTPEIPTGIAHGLRMTLPTGYPIASLFSLRTRRYRDESRGSVSLSLPFSPREIVIREMVLVRALIQGGR